MLVTTIILRNVALLMSYTYHITDLLFSFKNRMRNAQSASATETLSSPKVSPMDTLEEECWSKMLTGSKIRLIKSRCLSPSERPTFLYRIRQHLPRANCLHGDVCATFITSQASANSVKADGNVCLIHFLLPTGTGPWKLQRPLTEPAIT